MRRSTMNSMKAAVMMLALSGLCVITPAVAQDAAAVQTVAAEHPLYQWNGLPQWSKLTPEQIATDVRHCLELSRSRLAAICDVTPDNATWDTTFGAFERMDHELNTAMRTLHHMTYTMDSPEIRGMEKQLMPEYTEFTSSIYTNAELWQVIRTAGAMPWVKELSPEKQRYVQMVLDTFRDQGADLDDAGKARKIQIEKEMADLEMEFDKNMLDSTRAWQHVITDKAQLAGMSEEWLAKAAAAALKKGYGTVDEPQWLITLQSSSVMEVLRHCDVAATRKLCWEGRSTIGNTPEYDNAPIVARVMELRAELATLLGFRTYADMQNAHRMSGSGENALNFVDGLMQKLRPSFEKECAELMAFASEKCGRSVSEIPAWDLEYYRTAYANESNDMDPEVLRPYLSFEKVYRGIFDLYQHLYGIRIEKQPTAVCKPGESLPQGISEVWHKDVLLFKVTDASSGAHLGSFYIDPFPRETKQSGAWVLALHYGLHNPQTGTHAPHVSTLNTNLPGPTADKPALLSQYEVTILFHELGHMMHCMLGNTELRTHCGTNVPRDFVEMPSQLSENWAWTTEGMAYYAYHYQTGEFIPEELRNKLLKSRFSLPSLFFIRQLSISKLDLEMHSHYDTKFRGKDLEAATCALLDEWCVPGSTASPSTIRRLKHCVSGGYRAGYYAYQWAEVLCADGFTRFQKEGVTNPATGAAFRETILSKGNSRDPKQLFRDFIGREPNPDALIEQMGIK